MQRWKRLIYVTFLHFLPVFCQYPVRRQEVKWGNRHREKSWREDEMWETCDTTPPCRPTEDIINGLLLPDPQRHHQWAPPSRPRGIINELLHLGTQEWSLSGPIQAHRCHQWTSPSRSTEEVINEPSIQAHSCHQWEPPSMPTEDNLSEFLYPGP